jgi:hypothetical protein
MKTDIKIYRTVILRDVVYGCGTWSLNLTEYHTIRVSVSEVVWLIDHVFSMIVSYIVRQSLTIIV